MKRRLSLIVLLALVLAGCAGGNPLTGLPGPHGLAGFWSGLWHGLICPIAFVVSLFKASVSMYEVHNSGGWYNAGFILGAGAWGILRGRSSGRSLEKASDDAIRDEATKRGLISG